MSPLALLLDRFGSFSLSAHIRGSLVLGLLVGCPASLVSMAVVEVGQARYILVDKQKPTQSCKMLPKR